ncbi:MAG: hypothetical protein N4A32_02390 [Marinifilaceae bacterium]|jgi:hypothetical protein|nr:hypothetical protein [Marinifilaceae bacterium]
MAKKKVNKNNNTEKIILNSNINEELQFNEKKKIPKDTEIKEELNNKENVTSNFILNEDSKKQIKKLMSGDIELAVQDIKKDFLIIFGLFASFVTFISCNVQVFRNSTSISELVGVCSISLSFILFFALVINTIVKDPKGFKNIPYLNYVFVLIFLCLGIYFIKSKTTITNEQIIKQVNNKFDKQISKDSLNLNPLLPKKQTIKEKKN